MIYVAGRARFGPVETYPTRVDPEKIAAAIHARHGKVILLSDALESETGGDRRAAQKAIRPRSPARRECVYTR